MIGSMIGYTLPYFTLFFLLLGFVLDVLLVGDLSCLRQYSRSGPWEGIFFPSAGVSAIVCWCFADRCREKQDFVQEISRGGREIYGKYVKKLISGM